MINNASATDSSSVVRPATDGQDGSRGADKSGSAVSNGDLQQQAGQFRSLMTGQGSATDTTDAEAKPALPGDLQGNIGALLAKLGRQPDQGDVLGGRQQPLWSMQGQADTVPEILTQTAFPADSTAADLARGLQGGGGGAWWKLQDDRQGESDTDVTAQLQQQLLAQPSAALLGAAAPADPEAAFASLMEKHVRRLLVSESSATAGAGEEVHIQLSDAVLPDTLLSLTRVAGGWQLQANSHNTASREALQRYAPTLVQRFATRALGTLEIVVGE